MGRYTEALGTATPRALEETRTGFVGNADAVSAPDYTTCALPGIAHVCPRIVTWLRCRECHRGYFADGAAAPQPCSACVGGRLVPTSIWALAHEAAPPGMLRCGEV